jgi:hypothetical protein
VVAPVTGAGATGTGRFLLDTSACPELPEPAIRRLVAIEVGELLVEGGDARELDRITIRCDAGTARVAAAAASSPRAVARDLALRDFPGDAGPRALALAGLEALAALSPAVRARMETRQSAARPSPAVVVSAPPPTPPEPSLRFGLAFVRRAFLAENRVAAWGGRVEVEKAIAERGHLALDAEIDRTETSLPLGNASALLGSVGAFVGLRAGAGRVAGTLSLGARAGVARLGGAPGTGSTLVGTSVYRPWAGPAVAARACLGLGPIALAAFIESGVAARGAEGLVEGETVVAVSGAWLAGGAAILY